MKLIFELSKEQTTLPRAEVHACLTAEDIPYLIVDSNDDVLLVDAETNDTLITRVAERLACTFVIDELLFSCPATIPDIDRQAQDHLLVKEGSIAIRCKNRYSCLDSEQLIDHLGDHYTKNRKVNLRHPDIELRVIVTKKTTYVGIKKAEVNTSSFEQRRGHLRPFLSPITLHPKLARALVNLSSIKNNELLLDPFCGTGGILIEAGLLGITVIGSDIEKKMIQGCQKNLEYYSLKKFQLFCEDIGTIQKHVSLVDAIVTDFPYAKSTTTKGEHLFALYNRSFQNIADLLKKDGRAVIGLSHKDMVTVGQDYLSLREVFPLRAHRSLTRYFAVYQK